MRPPPPTPNVQDASPRPPLYRALSLSLQGSPSWDVQTCSTWTSQYRDTPSLVDMFNMKHVGKRAVDILLECFSCSEKSLVSFQRPIVASDKGDFQIKTLESLCWCCTWDIAVFRASALHFPPWVHYVLLHECVTFFHTSVFISTWMHYVLG